VLIAHKRTDVLCMLDEAGLAAYTSLHLLCIDFGSNCITGLQQLFTDYAVSVLALRSSDARTQIAPGALVDVQRDSRCV
jgi:hypothetical protein